MKLPTSWATKTPIPSSELSTTGKGLHPGNGGYFKGSLSPRHIRKLGQPKCTRWCTHAGPRYRSHLSLIRYVEAALLKPLPYQEASRLRIPPCPRHCVSGLK